MLFPELQNKIFGYVNLNVAAERWFLRNQISTDQNNPLLDAAICQTMVEDLHQELGLDFSYGGWLEDRQSLWRGSYLDQQQKYIHLGLDFNVPLATAVAAEYEAKVLRIDCDVPEEGGWGTRVILKPKDRALVVIYAHLDANIGCKVGDRLSSGDMFAKVGASPLNGGWFSHLHVQHVEQDHYHKLLLNDLHDLDGYAANTSLSELSRQFKDPLQIISLGR